MEDTVMCDTTTQLHAQSFRYRKLAAASIRLIRLAPVAVGDRLRCSILETSLEAAPSYDAISYVWGTEEKASTISITTERGEEELRITSNLAAALRCSNDSHGVRTLWADSISINQDDVEEKNQQVPLMGQIFRRARRVIIWLGPSDADQQAVMVQGLNRVSAAFSRVKEAARKLGGTTTGPELDEFHRSLGIPASAEPEFQAVLKLLRHPWFYRAWTWQESFLARERVFQYGRLIIPEKALQAVVVVIGRLPSTEYFAPGEYQCLLTMMRSLDGHSTTEESNTEFSFLIQRRRGSSCKYPADLIYSLLGAARDRPDVLVDYGRPFQEIFAFTAWQVMVQKDDLSILSLVEVPRECSDLPSWVPDWRSDRGIIGIGFDAPYRPSGTSRAQPQLSPNTKVLSLSGLKWDKVWKVFPIGEKEVQLEILTMRTGGSGRIYGHTGESYEDALRRTFFRDLDFTDPTKRWTPDSHERFHAIINRVYSDDPSVDMAFSRLANCLAGRTKGRNFIVTKSGRVGLVNEAAREGDHIVLLLGGHVPYVLRPMGDDANRYTFVSDGYIHGLMDGEGWNEARQTAQPEWDATDTSWLERLHREDIPFPVEKLHIH